MREAEETTASAPASIRSLRATFDPVHHSGYVARLVDAITGTPPAQNVAVAGAYGTGKSSVLIGLTSALEATKRKVLRVSLTSLAQSTDRSKAAKDALSEELQREIVKRLLYSVAPSTLPLSRFVRIRKRSFGAPLLLGLIVAAVATGLGLVFDIPLVIRRLSSVWFVDDWQWVGWVGDLLLIWGLAFVAQLAFARYRIRDISVGPARLTLEEDAGSYFDQYLDELLYFFERTKTSVVLFEDMDRFGDTDIYLELRELNLLVNQAEQITNVVTFVYAVRDSLFDQKPLGRSGDKRIGVDSPASDRAKFFDTIVPLVPFISHEVASDLLSDALAGLPPESRPSAEIQKIAGRYFTDMRVLLSIRNEYVVFLDELLSKTKIEGLNPDGLFAMVLYKVSHPTEFELVRTGDSTLDRLLAAVTKATERRLAWFDIQISNSASAAMRDANLNAMAVNLAQRLADVMELQNAIRSPGSTANLSSISLTAGVLTREELNQGTAWDMIANDYSPRITAIFDDRSSINFRRSELERALGLGESLEAHIAKLSPGDAAQLESLRAERQRLLRSSLSQKVQDGTLSGPGVDIDGKSFEVDFPRLADQYVGRGLVRRLVEADRIDQNFGLYATAYYGKFLSAAARGFIMRYVDHHLSAPLDALVPEDVDEIIRRYGDDFLRDPSSLNVSVVDRLVARKLLPVLIEQIIGGQPDIVEDFVATYLTSGKHPHALVGALAARWPRILDFLAENPRLEARTKLMDTALSSMAPSVDYRLSDETKKLLAAQLDTLESLKKRLSAGAPVALSQLLEQNGLEVANLAMVDQQTREELALRGAFELTRENLATISGDKKLVGLDTLSDRLPQVADKAMANVVDYVNALHESNPHATSIDKLNRLNDIGNRASAVGPDTLRQVLEERPPDSGFDDIQDLLEVSHWPIALETGAVLPSVANVVTYRSNFPGLDSSLQSFLQLRPELIDATNVGIPDRTAIAIDVANGGLDAATTLTILDSLDLDAPLDVNSLSLADGGLAADLLRAGHIEDTADTFNGLAELDWGARDRLIAASADFAAFAVDVTFGPDELGQIAESRRIADSTKRLVIERLEVLAASQSSKSISSSLTWAGSKNVELPRPALEAVLAVGVEVAPVLLYLGNHNSHLTDADFLAIVQQLPGELARLSNADGSKIRLPNRPGLESTIRRLQGVGVAGRYRSLLNGDLLVYMRG